MKLGQLVQRFTGKQKKSPNKTAGNKGVLAFDLLYQLSYTSVIAAAGAPRNQIFERTAELSCASAEYFKRMELTCKRLGYDYARSCRIVGEAAEEEEMKALLLRLSNSLVSGEPEGDFFAREAEVQAHSYENDYGRKLESLKQWTDAYVSLVLSSVLVIIIGIVSTMIYPLETVFILGLAFASVCSTVLGVWLIYLMSPKEAMLLPMASSREQKLVVKMFKMLVPLTLVLCAILLAGGADLGWVLLVAAILVFPVGFLSAVDDGKVAKRGAEVGAFLASLGGVCSAIGTTVKEALGRLDLKAMNFLRTELRWLHTRLECGIRPKLCWQRFIAESGSELVNRSVGMFYDAVEIGGEPGQAGYHSSLFDNRISRLRARRKTVASPFRWLCISMHASVVALLAFITEVVCMFGEMVAKASESMPPASGVPAVSAFTTFSFSGLDLMQRLVVPLILILTVANAIAPTIADGGNRYTFLYNLAIAAAISGVTLVFLPKLASALFASIEM